MSYRYRTVGDDGAPVPATDASAEQTPTVADKTPPYTRQTLSLMGVAAIPWLPVLAGGWIGKKIDGEDGKVWGWIGGGLFTFLVMRHFVKKTSGVIT